QILVAPTRQQLELVTHAPDLPGVLLLVKDVVDEQIARRSAACAAVATGLLETLLGQVVEDREGLVEGILKTLDDGFHVRGLHVLTLEPAASRRRFASV